MTGSAALSHLSIGEVLSLVQEDFPDVTISKIRFLESQGLIAPERTASGYRKFYESDIDRLRWILRQQRDNFLPLKVIKRMLEEGADSLEGGDAQPTLWSTSTDDAERGTRSSPAQPGGAAERDGAAADAAVLEGTETVSTRVAERTDRNDTPQSASHPAVRSAPRSGDSTGSPDTGTPRVRDSADRAQSDAPAPTGDGADGGPSRSGVESAPTRPALNTPADVVAALQEQPPTPRSTRARRRSAAEAARSSSTGSGGADALSEPAVGTSLGQSSGTGSTSTSEASAAGAVTDEVAADHGTARSHTDGSADASPDAPMGGTSIDGVVSDAQLSREELLAATGLDPELLADLESYGIIVASAIGGTPSYDAAALQIARLATKYAALGVEARHLRMYKVSAEREAGFIEQLVFPLLKQRNPAARQLAAERDRELTEMGAELHAALLRRQIGPLFGS